MSLVHKTMGKARAILLDDTKRIRLQFIWVYCVLTAVALFMTVVNVLTGKYLLMLATLAFGILCGVNVLLARKGGKPLRVSSWLFSVEMLALLTFFVVSGTPEGFSAIWACLLPASGLLLFRRKYGTVMCAAMLLILLFFFQTTLGNSFLQYPYTASFKLRFPMLYVAFFVLSFLLETIRAITFDEMKKAQEKYEYLYRHDALTGVYNRYGFNERMDALLLASPCPVPVSLLIVDLDYFKQVNDKYGHSTGDMVLKEVAALLVQQSGPDADVCRWGGEEFAIMLKGEADALACGQRILTALRDTPFPSAAGDVRITASIGAALSPSAENLDPAVFVRAADNCLYAAKAGGRNALRSVRMTLQGEAEAAMTGEAEALA